MRTLKYLLVGFCSVSILASASSVLAENCTLQGNNIYNNNSGNVGIGTTTPTQALDVKGNIKMTGSLVSDGDICIGTCQ